MSRSSSFQSRIGDTSNVLGEFVDLYDEHLKAGRYCAQRGRRSTACILHFGDWLHAVDVDPSAIDEATIGRFLTEHLPVCDCGNRVPRERILNRAAQLLTTFSG